MMRYYALLTALMLSLWFSTAGHWLSFTPESTSTQPLAVLQAAHSAYGDDVEYELMSQGGESYAPYKYRVLIPALAGATGLPPLLGFLIVNMVCFVLTGVCFSAYLRRDFSPTAAAFGGVLAVTTFAMQNTTLFPYIEPGSYLAFVALLWAARSRKAALFVCVAILAVLVKEVMAFLAVGLWSIEALSVYRETRRNRADAPAGIRNRAGAARRLTD